MKIFIALTILLVVGNAEATNSFFSSIGDLFKRVGDSLVAQLKVEGTDLLTKGLAAGKTLVSQTVQGS